MGNSLRRPRARPRVRSVNFRAFFWCVRREAYYQLLRRRYFHPPCSKCSRASVLALDTRRLMWHGRVLLRLLAEVGL